MISLTPSITCASSSGAASLNFIPIRSTDSVRFWLILIHECFANSLDSNARLNGKPAR